MPEIYRMRIDMDAFMSSFSFVDEEDVRWTLSAWIRGPGHRYSTETSSSSPTHDKDPPTSGTSASDTGRAHQGNEDEDQNATSPSSTPSPECSGSRKLDDSLFTSQESIRQLAREQWLWYYNHTAAHIPAATDRNCNLPSLDDYPGEFELDTGEPQPEDGESDSEDEVPEVVQEDEEEMQENEEEMQKDNEEPVSNLDQHLPMQALQALPRGGRPADKGTYMTDIFTI